MTRARDVANSTTALSVDGTVKLDGNYPVGTGNVALGDDALRDGSLSGGNNTAIGHYALYANTSGTENTSVGRGNLDANTTGSHNTALGSTALSSSTTGSYNTALGSLALNGNTTAINNTAVGYQALYDNTTGDSSTAVGFQALANATTGNSNSAFGTEALKYTTTGIRNSAFGGRDYDNGASSYGTLNLNTTGSYNSAFGQGALANNTTAFSNTAVGYQAGYLNQTGYSSVYVGLAAGYNATGIRNTFVGADAGSLITSGAENTILGRYNGNQGGLDIRTASNNIVLSDGAGNPRLFYKYSTVNWNIETPAAWNNALIVHNTTGAGAYGIQIDHDLDVNNTSKWFIHAIGNTTSRFKVFTNGNVVNTNNSYGAISDVKLKENIVDAASQWDDIKALTVRKYSMKTDELDAPNMLGVIAQELETAGMSGLVNESPDIDKDMNDLGTTTKSVNYSILYMKAVKALQEAMTRIEALETKVTALEGA